MRKLFIALFILTTTALKAQTDLPLMPWPKSVEMTDGQFRLTREFTVMLTGSGNEAENYINRAIARLSRRTGLFFDNPVVSQGSGGKVNITFDKNTDLNVGADESYKLVIAPGAIDLTAPTQLGVMRGVETLLQLLSSDKEGYYFPAVIIQDNPRFVWRGLLMDVCRHWMPLEVVKRNLDAMAAVKMNVLHLHLTEDQGFRIESKVFPKLHEMGSDGNYFTQEEIKEIVRYAAARGIRVVPEFDIPGHTTSWFVGYPELASAPGPYQIARTFGVHDPTMDPTKETTYEFLDKFLTEMAGLFPDTYMHIGGDENNGKQWDANPEISKFKEANGFASNHELQAYFNVRIAKILTKLNKRMVGWDEIADEDLPKSIVIQSWRGKQGLIDAAENGFDVLLSNGYYIDLSQPASYHYLNDPLPVDVELSAEAKEHILGGEATMWAELVTPETVDSRIWPRTAAIAERLWSSGSVNDVASMYKRLQQVAVQLEEHGVTHIKNQDMLIRRLVGNEHLQVYKTLVKVLEPVEGYKRHRFKKYTTYSPLTRIPDIAQPDAFAAMKFNALIKQYLADHEPALKDEIKSQLLIWVENHKQMKQLAQEYPAVREALPLSSELSKIAILGLQAMSTTVAHDSGWKTAAKSTLKGAAKINVECEIKVVAGIEMLVDSAK